MDDCAAKLLDAIHEMSPAIARLSAEIESARRLPADLVNQLATAGCFRMFVPRSHAGLEISLPDALTIFEKLANADGSVGWTAMIGAEAAQLLALLPRRRFDALYADTPDLLAAGSFTPGGEAKVVTGGFEVSGRWPFASGCLHSNWLIGNCVVTQNGQPRASQLTGAPELRMAIFRAARAQIIDSWFVAGLRGTGSNDIAADRLYVADDDTFVPFLGEPSIPGPLYVAATSQFSLHVASVGVGIAQRALDEVVALAATQKRRLFASAALADTPVFQHDLARAEVSLRAARALLAAQAETFWEVCSGKIPTPAERAQTSATGAWAAATASQVVDFCYSAAGGTAVYDSSPLQRCLRDIRTLTQHISVANGWFTRAGTAILGRDPGFGAA
jgi:alkylation response protein AidB-like acyl-CoA dehydrogenase